MSTVIQSILIHSRNNFYTLYESMTKSKCNNKRKEKNQVIHLGSKGRQRHQKTPQSQNSTFIKNEKESYVFAPGPLA
jgi:hypothetical protein